jgi:hypothetical protein
VRAVELRAFADKNDDGCRNDRYQHDTQMGRPVGIEHRPVHATPRTLTYSSPSAIKWQTMN